GRSMAEDNRFYLPPSRSEIEGRGSRLPRPPLRPGNRNLAFRTQLSSKQVPMPISWSRGSMMEGNSVTAANEIDDSRKNPQILPLRRRRPDGTLYTRQQAIQQALDELLRLPLN